MASNATHLALRNEGEATVRRDEILKGMADFDKNYRGRDGVADTYHGWFIEENGRRYPTKLLIKLGSGIPVTKFNRGSARKTLTELAFDVRRVDETLDVDQFAEDAAEIEEVEEAAIETTFGIERDLQRALRGKIEQLEPGMKISDGGQEKIVESGRIDITAEDKNGDTVVIELKAGKAGRDAVGQILAYMGDLTTNKKLIRGILVAGEFSPRAVAAARVISSLQLRKYSFSFKFESVGVD